MKMKNMMVVINSVLLMILVIGGMIIQPIGEGKKEIVHVHDQYNKVHEALEKGIEVEVVEALYACRILKVSEEDYMKVLYQVIASDDYIFDYIENGQLKGKIIFAYTNDGIMNAKKKLTYVMILTLIFLFISMNYVFYSIYKHIINPFKHLQKFASRVAAGDLDEPLAMHKHNYFGAFTESFDSMREALKMARKKEVEDATLEELETLRVMCQEVPSTCIYDMIKELNYYGLIQCKSDIPKCLVVCDPLRMNQVLDNLITNAYKYANTVIDIGFFEEKDVIVMQVHDYGKSLEDKDIPLLCHKFYRGDNAANKVGAGLGLYLAKQFM